MDYDAVQRIHRYGPAVAVEEIANIFTVADTTVDKATAAYNSTTKSAKK